MATTTDLPLGYFLFHEMGSSMPIRRYDPVTMSLHWIIALAVFAAYGIGLVREELPRGAFRTSLLSLHMSIGLLVIALTVFRIGWRSMTPAPATLPASWIATLAARLVHLGLYAAMLAVPLVGILAVWLRGRPVEFFSLFAIQSAFTANPAWVKTLQQAHEIAAHLLMALAGVHALAAIGHHLVLKDATLSRMLPFLTPRRSNLGA